MTETDIPGEPAPRGAKVLLIAPQPFYEERGTPMNVRLMCSILGAAGYAVDLLVFPTGNPLDIPGVRVIRLPNILLFKHIPIGFSWKKMFLDCLLPVWCAGLCLKNRYQVVHGVEEGGIVAVAAGFLFIRGAATVYDMDSVLSDQFSAGGVKTVLREGVRRLEAWAIRRATLVLTVCHSLTDAARSVKPGAEVAQIEDIPLEFAFPTDRDDIQQAQQEVAAMLQANGLENKQILLYTGNLQAYQGIDLLVEAWERYIGACGDDASGRLVVVGGPQQLVAAYRERCQGMQHGETICFIGPRPAQEMSAWMERAQALISPRSAGENTPLKIYTYMAAGKPIIATRRTTHTQVLSDSTAFLVAPEKEAMAAAIRQALHESEGAHARAQAAMELVREKYSYKVFATKLLDAYTRAQQYKSNNSTS